MNSKQIIGHIMAATGKPVPAVAKEHGFSKVSFYSAINGWNKSPKIRGIIVSITGLQEGQIWPSEDGYENGGNGQEKDKKMPQPLTIGSLRS